MRTSSDQFSTAINFGDAAQPSAPAASQPRAAEPGSGGPLSFSFGFGDRIPRKDLIEILGQVAVMLQSGVTVHDALHGILEQTHKPQVRAVLERVVAGLSAGGDLSGVCARHPRSFPRVLVAMIRASEQSGTMPQMLDRAAGYLRDEQDIVRRVRGAMTYPAIMFVFAVATTVLLLMFVLPRFTMMYEGREHLLPMPTTVLLTISDTMVQNWLMLLLGLAAGLVLLWRGLRTEAGRSAWHAAQLRIPLVGGMLRKLHLSRGIRMLSTLTGAGVSLPETLDTACELATNVHYSQMWECVSEQVQQGRPLSEVLREQPLVPPMVAQMIRSGEAGGRLSEVAGRIADYGERELKETIGEVTRYIEPVMIVAMGAIIGGVVMALLLPIFTVSRVMTQ